MSRQTTKDRKAAREAARADAFIAAAVGSAKRTRTAKPETLCTAEQIVEERDRKGLSWAQVAANLGLGSPGAARSAYSKLTGRPHTESNPTIQRAHKGATTAGGTRRAVRSVSWDDDADQDEIIAAITHHDVRIVRTFRDLPLPDEWLHICRIERFAYEGPNDELTVRVYTKEACECRLKDPRDADTGRARAFRVSDIAEVL